MSFFTKKSVALAAALLLAGGTASAAVITGWNLANVAVGTGTAGESTINDGASNNTGRVTFNGTTGFTPGIKVVNDDPLAVTSDGKVPNGYNCIMANTASDITCNAEKKTHKRLKFQTTSSAPTDMVFDVNPNGSFTTAGNDGLYKVFQAFGNDTNSLLESFRVTLGLGIGANFTKSSATDGLSFVQRTKPFQNNEFSSFFSEGLFGGGMKMTGWMAITAMSAPDSAWPSTGWTASTRPGCSANTKAFSGRCCPMTNCRWATTLTLTVLPAPTTC
jgi:hypothetical protein